MSGTEKKKVEEDDRGGAGNGVCSELEEIAFNIVLEKMTRKERSKSSRSVGSSDSEDESL